MAGYNERKELRKDKAILRQDEYNSLTLEEKIAKAKKAPGNSAKQLKKLEFKLNQELLIAQESENKPEKKTKKAKPLGENIFENALDDVKTMRKNK